MKDEYGHSQMMNCEQIAELLPDYLEGSLRRGQDDVAEHLRQCAACREAVALWNKLGLLPQEEASPELRARFEAMLSAYQSAQAEAGNRLGDRRARVIPFWSAGWQGWAAGLAAAAILLVAGFAAGRYTAKGAQELTMVRSELSDMRQLVVLSMLQQQSASARLQAIAYGAEQGQDPKVQEAMLRALRYDPNVDVRLAALNALAAHGKQPDVKTGLVDALQPQQSPLVQVALIDTLVEMRDPRTVRQLQTIQQDPKLNPSVRKRVDWALAKLNVN